MISRGQWRDHCEEKRKESYADAEQSTELPQAEVEAVNLDGHEAQLLLQMVAGKIEAEQKDIDALSESILHCPLDTANTYLTTMRACKYRIDALEWVLAVPQEIRRLEEDALHE